MTVNIIFISKFYVSLSILFIDGFNRELEFQKLKKYD